MDNTTFLDVNVRNPIIHHVKGDTHTSYDISIETNNSSFTMPRSTVRRRFSEFISLKNLLKELQPSLTPPRLPSKTLLKRFDDKFIEERRSGLETFLRNVLTEPLYLSNKSLHLFIQTSLTMKEIEGVVKGTEGTYIPESKPPIVLALHDEVFDEVG
uniref:PX domain-containing protein n=1 Tax=Amblyomma maculatum TaxID=34609 RepID=G3MNT4_AMBMU